MRVRVRLATIRVAPKSQYLGLYACLSGFAILELVITRLTPKRGIPNMTKVTLYCVQPVLIAGFQTILDRLDGFTGNICMSLTDLMDHIGTERPQLIVFEVTSTIDLETLRKVIACDRDAAIILWVDEVSAEFASQAISLGVRGLLRRSLPIEIQARCLDKVAAGEMWVEKTLSNKLLSTRRIALTPRERQLVVLVAQGLKNKEIAYTLGISEGTVKVYLCRLFSKTGVNDRLELALFALKNLFVSQACEAALPVSPGGSKAGGCMEPVPAAAFVPSFICVDRLSGYQRG
jgi:DNA-binding NarL/FixJ family response regulator